MKIGKILFSLCICLWLMGTISSKLVSSDSDGRVVSLLRYLEHLENAKALLAASNPDGAIHECTEALRLGVPNTVVPQLRMKTKGAVAYYLLACAHASKRERQLALENLQKAAENGFSNTCLVESDERLSDLRGLRKYEEVLSFFPKSLLSDQYSGKTVADQKFGMGLIHARKNNFPKLGESAPDFELEYRDGSRTLKLSDFQEKKPVVLIFGSYT